MKKVGRALDEMSHRQQPVHERPAIAAEGREQRTTKTEHPEKSNARIVWGWLLAIVGVGTIAWDLLRITPPRPAGLVMAWYFAFLMMAIVGIRMLLNVVQPKPARLIIGVVLVMLGFRRDALATLNTEADTDYRLLPSPSDLFHNWNQAGLYQFQTTEREGGRRPLRRINIRYLTIDAASCCLLVATSRN